MINRINGFHLNVRLQCPISREYLFAFITIFLLLIIIYNNSFHGTWALDDYTNIVDNKNIFLKTLDWHHLSKTFYGIEGNKINRPLSYLSFAINYYLGGLNTFGYHAVNFIIHYLTSIFLFLFINRTLRLPLLQNRYTSYSYSIALLATVFWATSPVQVTAVTYIVQRMASMAGMFYIIAMYCYLLGRIAKSTRIKIIFFSLCFMSTIFSIASKENAIMIPICIWLYDILLIQGATKINIIKNLKLFIAVFLFIIAISLWNVDIMSILSGTAYQNRPFTLIERILTEPRIIIFYITLLIYPIGSRMTLCHDIELSTSLISPWTTLPAIATIILILFIAGFIARKRPLLSFCIFFFFINHLIESTILPLELIYEHRNYIPSMFFFVPIVILMLHIIDYFSYKKAIQYLMIAVFTFLIIAQGQTVYERNHLFSQSTLLWEDNVEKAPMLSRPHNDLGTAYWEVGRYSDAYKMFLNAAFLNRYPNNSLIGINLCNLGKYHLYIKQEYDKALTFFKAAISAYPGYWSSYHEASVCYIRKGNLDEAERRLKWALSYWPDNAHFHHLYSFVLLKYKQYDRAIEEAQRALSLDSNKHTALCVLGESFSRKGKKGLAIYYWEKYIERDPKDLEGNLALMELYARQNRRDKLSRTIGILMVLKGTSSWGMLVEKFTANSNIATHEPDAERIFSIVRSQFNDVRL